MEVNESGLYKVNADLIRPAKVVKKNADGTGDIMVFVHPDDYPEFSQAECQSGNGFRRNVVEGIDNNEFKAQR